LDQNGVPVKDSNGQPVPDKTKPIYDLTQSQTDKDNPYQQQKSAVDQLRALIAQRSARGYPTRPMDLTGLMMAADFLNHTNTFVPGYSKMRENQEEAIKNR